MAGGATPDLQRSLAARGPQQAPHLLAHLEWWRVYYHFVHPHTSLRVAFEQPREGVANAWRNAIANERRLWPPAEPIDDGQRAR